MRSTASSPDPIFWFMLLHTPSFLPPQCPRSSVLPVARPASRDYIVPPCQTMIHSTSSIMISISVFIPPARSRIPKPSHRNIGLRSALHISTPAWQLYTKAFKAYPQVSSNHRSFFKSLGPISYKQMQVLVLKMSARTQVNTQALFAPFPHSLLGSFAPFLGPFSVSFWRDCRRK